MRSFGDSRWIDQEAEEWVHWHKESPEMFLQLLVVVPRDGEKKRNVQRRRKAVEYSNLFRKAATFSFASSPYRGMTTRSVAQLFLSSPPDRVFLPRYYESACVLSSLLCYLRAGDAKIEKLSNLSQYWRAISYTLNRIRLSSLTTSYEDENRWKEVKKSEEWLLQNVGHSSRYIPVCLRYMLKIRLIVRYLLRGYRVLSKFFPMWHSPQQM